MTEPFYLPTVILVMAGATFLTRLLPFLLFRNRAEHPLTNYLGRYLPPAIMTILVLYSLQGVDLAMPPFGARELIALLVTGVVGMVLGPVVFGTIRVLPGTELVLGILPALFP